MKKKMVSIETCRTGKCFKVCLKKNSKGMILKFILAVIISFGSSTAFILLDPPGYAQSLNDATNAQLEFVGGIECGLLLDGDSAGSVLKGGLLGICTRGAPAGGVGPSGSGGGGQGTATSRPSVVEERLKEARGEEEPEEGEADIELEYGKFGVYLSGEYDNFDKDSTKFEDGYNSIIRRLVVGADVQLTKNVLAGLAFDTYGQDGRFDGPVGDFDVDSYRFVAYGSFRPISNFSVQTSVNYGITSTERKRFASFEQLDSFGDVDFSVQGTPRSNFDADQFGAFIIAGYNLPVGPVTLSPRAGYEWQRVAYENYRESGSSGLELKFDDFDITSSLSTVGLAGSIAFGTRYGVLVPQASFDWKHQFDLDQQNLDVSFIDDTRSKKFSYQNENPDRDYYEINAGLVFVMPNGVQAFGNYRTITSNSIFDSDAYTFGLRYGF